MACDFAQWAFSTDALFIAHRVASFEQMTMGCFDV